MELYFPKNTDEVINILAEKPSSILHAGGTDMVPLLKNQDIKTEGLIFLSSISDSKLKEVTVSKEQISIGSLMTLHDLANNQNIKELFPILSDTANKIASPQIRYKATIGGNILVDNRCIYYNQTNLNQNCHGKCFKADGDVCHLIKSAKKTDDTACRARFVSDLVPMLQVMNASIVLFSKNGSKEIKLQEFYKNDGIEKNLIKSSEFLVSINIPINNEQKLHYKKLRVRQAIDFASLGVALALDQQQLRVGITGVDTKPIYKEFELSEIQNAETICMKAVSPLKQDFYPPAYRKKMVKVFIEQGLKEISQKVTRKG